MNQHFLLHLYELKQLNLENLLSLWLVKCFCEIGPSLQDATTWSWGPSAAFLLGFSHHQANFFEQTANLKVLSSQKFINSIFSQNKISFYPKNRNTPASFLITMYLNSGTQTRVCQMQCKHATTLPFSLPVLICQSLCNSLAHQRKFTPSLNKPEPNLTKDSKENYTLSLND